MSKTLNGRCECGAVCFTVDSPNESVTACHCEQCRRTSGHYWVSMDVDNESLTFTKLKGLIWYSSSEHADRGFCKTCGSSLFFRSKKTDGISIAAGCLEGPTDLVIGKHIFVANKGDYYELLDDVPKFDIR